jgi:hypothetical protein
MSLRQVADSYGVSTAFLVRALAQVGFDDAQADSPVPSVILRRFEAKFGAEIREAKAKQAPASRPSPFTTSHNRSKPHVMRVAHAKVGAGRDSAGNRVKRLLDNPGIVHAIDAAGTWDGDPWKGDVHPNDVHFFGGSMNSGPSAACGLGHMRAILSEEFVPADDPEAARQCKRCADLVADGEGFRDGPGYLGSPYCDDSVRVKIDENVTVKTCYLRYRHPGPHRAPDKSEWEIGSNDYVPAPDEIGSRITKPS